MRCFRLTRFLASPLVLVVVITFAVVTACSEESSTAACPGLRTVDGGYPQAHKNLEAYYREMGINREVSYELEDYGHIYNVSTASWVQGVDPASPERWWVEFLLELKAAQDAGCITYPYPRPVSTAPPPAAAGASGTP